MKATEQKTVGMVQTFDTDALAAIVTGDVDVVRIASAELASRGFNLEGKWVGFPEAKRLHDERMRDRRAGLKRLRRAAAETHDRR